MSRWLAVWVVLATGCSKTCPAALDAARTGDVAAVAKLGSVGGCKDSLGRNPLHVAAVEGKAAVVPALVAKGASLEAQDREQRTPLCEAAKHGNRDAAAALLDAGASLHPRCRGIGMEPLHIAGGADAVDVVKLLLERGADPNAKDDWEQTPLHQVANEASSGVEVAKVLIAAHAELEVHDNQGFTPLQLAVFHDNLPLVVALLDGGANPNATTNAGRSSLDVANDKHFEDIVAELEKRGAKKGARGDTKVPQ